MMCPPPQRLPCSACSGSKPLSTVQLQTCSSGLFCSEGLGRDLHNLGSFRGMATLETRELSVSGCTRVKRCCVLSGIETFFQARAGPSEQLSDRRALTISILPYLEP